MIIVIDNITVMIVAKNLWPVVIVGIEIVITASGFMIKKKFEFVIKPIGTEITFEVKANFTFNTVKVNFS